MPRQPSERLFTLIKAMSKAEKRYFKLFAAGKKDNNYIKLFDAIDNQNKYDETKILKKGKYITQLPKLKNYLYDALLESLNACHSKNSIDFILKNLLGNVEILYQKGLYDQSMPILQKAKAIAYYHEKLDIILEITSWERKILNIAGITENKITYSSISEERKQVIKKLSLLHQYVNVNDLLYSYVTQQTLPRNSKELTRLKKIVVQLPGKGKLYSDLFFAQYFLNNSYMIYANLIGNTEQFHKRSKQIVDLFENNAPIREEQAGLYISCVHNYIFSLIELKKYNDALVYNQKLKTTLLNSPSGQAQRIKGLSLIYMNETSIFIWTGQFQKGISSLQEIEKYISDFGSKMNQGYKIILLLNIAVLFFGVGKYRKSLEWLNKVLNYPGKEIKQGHLDFAKLMNLIIHYEIGNHDLLEYAVRSTYRFFARKENLQKLEKAFLDFIRRSTIDMTKAELILLFKSLRKKFVAIQKTKGENSMFAYFDFISWLESKIENKSFAEIVKTKVIS